MKKSISRVLALTLALVMLLSAIPMVSAASCANGVHEYVVRSTTAATCSKEGSQTLRCKNCSDEIVRTLPKLEHTVKWTYPAEASCAKDFVATGECTKCSAEYNPGGRYHDESLKMTVKKGSHLVAIWSYPESWDCTKNSVELVGTCEICKAEDVKKTITIEEPAKEHTWSAWVYPEGEFDCLKGDKDGKAIKRTHTCTVCNKTVSETPKEHTVPEDAKWTIKEGQLCTAGHNLVATCTACGCTAEKYEAAKDHTLVESTIVKPADAQCEKGYTMYGDCSECGAKRVGVEVKAGKCDVKTWSYPEKGTYSCTGKNNVGNPVPFKMVGTCSVCGQKCETNPTGTEIRGSHDVSVWTLKEGEDCTAAGHVMTGVCNECGYTVERKATADEVYEKHNIPNPTSISGAIPSNCLEGFSVAGYCTVCKRTRTNTIEAGTAHTLGEYKVTKAPTCVMDGEETADCSKCDSSVKRIVKADGKTHKFGIDGQCINTNEDGTMQCVANRGSAPTVNSLTVQVGKASGIDVVWSNGGSATYSNFKSGNTAIATVNSSGMVTGVAPGIVEITFDAKYGSETINLKCTVTVVANVGINCPSTSVKYSAGAVAKLSPTLTSAVGDVTWSVSNANTSVATATINSTTGALEVVAKTAGVAKLTVSAKFKSNGKNFTATEDVYVSFYQDTQMTLTVASNVGTFNFTEAGVFSKIVVGGTNMTSVNNRSLASLLSGGVDGYVLRQNEANSVVGKITGNGWEAGATKSFNSLSGLNFTCMSNGEFDLSYQILGNENVIVGQGVITIVVNSTAKINLEASKDKYLALDEETFTKFWTSMNYSGAPTSITISKNVSVGGLYTEKGLNTKVKVGDTFYFTGSADQLGDVVYMPKNQNNDYSDEFTFVMKNGSEELYGTAKITVTEKLPFTDVKTTDWYYAALQSAYKNDLINGVTATQFKPNSNLTVAQAIKLAAALHQMDKDGKVTLTNGAGSSWYSTYVKYAVDNKIIEAKYGNYTLAQMNKTITRSEFVHIFYGAMNNYTVINTVAANAIPDVKTGANYAEEIYAFYRAGILTGSDSKGTFYPNNNIKRSEVAAILIRMYDTAQRESDLTLS